MATAVRAPSAAVAGIARTSRDRRAWKRPSVDNHGVRVIADLSVGTVLADPARFTGRVWRSDYLMPPDRNHLTGLRFLYEPGARSFWHVHDREQVIIAISGHGLARWDGVAKPLLLGSGDWWHVTPDVPHWHGATPNSAFSHVAVTSGGSTSWLGPVSDDDYLTATRT